MGDRTNDLYRDLDALQLDLLTTIARIEQAYAQPRLADMLLRRLATCDAPRLRSYLIPCASAPHCARPAQFRDFCCQACSSGDVLRGLAKHTCLIDEGPAR